MNRIEEKPMKRLLLCGALVLVLILSACQQHADDAEAEIFVGASSVPMQTANYTLPGYLTKLADGEMDMDCILSRDDVGIQLTLVPLDARRLVKCILKMGLVPYKENQKILDIPHPFTLICHVNGKNETISVMHEKVTISGTDYSPTNPGALSEFFEEDYERLLTGDIYLLQEQMPFTADEIAEVHLEEHGNYSDDVTEVSTTDRAEIDKISHALFQTVARRFEADEAPEIFIGVGGSDKFCRLIMEDGTQWSINPRRLTTITSTSGEEDILVLSMDHEAVFGLLTSNSSIPVPQVRIDDITPTVYEKSYQVDCFQKSKSHTIPIDMYYDSDPVLLPKEAYTCRLEWIDAAGKPVVPAGITATLYQEAPDAMQEVGEETPLQVDGSTLTLPGSADRYFVSVRAQFTGNNWAEFIFSYRSSIYPTAFYDIPYGNDDGNVALTRNDSGVTVTGTQNRKYVNFIMDLGLSSSTGSQQDLLIRKPFTMTFSCDNTLYEFAFSDKGVTYNGKPYTVGNPQRIEALYAPFDVEDPNMFERINYDLRGFLTKDVICFTDEFPLSADEIQEFTIVKEEPEQRICHNMSSLAPKEIMDILNYVVLGNNWQAKDYYTFRRFHLSYEVILKDGTTYEIGERILKN
ncbi:MAG: hypothetical protein ACERKO_11090, partial [Acetanaerobacterium sp.]